jgi:hypothetical protein
MVSLGLRYSRSAPRGEPLGGRERDPSFREPLGCEVVAPAGNSRAAAKIAPLTRSKRGEPAEGSLNLIVPTPVTFLYPLLRPSPEGWAARGRALPPFPWKGWAAACLAYFKRGVHQRRFRFRGWGLVSVGASAGPFLFFPLSGAEKRIGRPHLFTPNSTNPEI